MVPCNENFYGNGRSMEKAKATADAMRKATGNPSIKPYAADLSSMAQVRKLAGEVKNSHGDVDVLINNAGT